MTRINVGIPVKLLTREHLQAEHREIKRIPNALAKYKNKLNTRNIPKRFKLGDGHVRFFYDKGAYTLRRYKEIHDMCIKRGLKVQDYTAAWNVYSDYPDLFIDYQPTQQDCDILMERLIERNHKHYAKFEGKVRAHVV